MSDLTHPMPPRHAVFLGRCDQPAVPTLDALLESPAKTGRRHLEQATQGTAHEKAAAEQRARRPRAVHPASPDLRTRLGAHVPLAHPTGPSRHALRTRDDQTVALECAQDRVHARRVATPQIRKNLDHAPVDGVAMPGALSHHEEHDVLERHGPRLPRIRPGLNGWPRNLVVRAIDARGDAGGAHR